MYRKLPVFDDLLTFSMRDTSQSRHERRLLAPCLAFSGSGSWIAGSSTPVASDVEPRTGFIVSQHCHALATDEECNDDGRTVVPAVLDGASLIDSLPHLVWTSDANGLVTAGNARWQEFAGAPQAGTPWTALLLPDEQPAAWSVWTDHVARREGYEAEHRLRDPDGTERWALARIVPLQAPDGSLSGWCGSFTDFHALKSREAQLDFLACELTHRIQNIFAVVESLLSLSARTQPQAADFAQAACARIRSLARANDYIRPQRGPRAQSSLHGLLTILLAPYQMGDPAAASVEIAGPDHDIGSASATMLALVVHELATNAAKYGALSQNGGRVVVNTSLDDGQYHLVWTESGGPPVSPDPATRGFGTLLTDRALRQPLGAHVERLWSPDGLIVKISLPCDRLAC